MAHQHAIVYGITSDIGAAIARAYSAQGYMVTGSHRPGTSIEQFRSMPRLNLFPSDLADKQSVDRFALDVQRLNHPWTKLVICPCTPFPLKAFFEADFEEWQESVHINAIEQLRLLHRLYPARDRSAVPDVVFFAGGGVNNAVVNFSAYSISKIMLIKMCEYIDAEAKDINIFIVGPGWVRTKVHNVILEKLDHSDERYQKTVDFLAKGDGTPLEDIFRCIEWLSEQGRAVASGRNFSVVHDAWSGPGSAKLAAALKADPGMYKLVRARNDFLP